MYVITIIASALALIAPDISAILSVAAELINIVIYIIFLVYLAKAKKMLAM